MKPKKKVEKAIRNKLWFTAGSTLRDRLLTDVMNAREESMPIRPVPCGPGIGRRLMKTRIARVASVAAVIAVAALALTFWSRSSAPAYAITDLPMLLGEIQTLHVQSTVWLYETDSNQPEFEQAIVIPCELWLDVPGLREYFTSSSSWSRPDGTRGISRIEGVRTAKYAMDIDHTRRLVWFNKTSPIMRRLTIRDQIEDRLHRITEEHLEHFVRVGQETIEGVLFDIWERIDAQKKTRCWMAPATGELGRIYIWAKDHEDRWRLSWCAETIERDVEVPEEVFAFDPPPDYEYQNTLETATLGEGLGTGWYFMGRARVCVAVSFTLADGSMIVAWHSDDLEQDRYVDQTHLFQDLTPGGELPKLPMVVYGLKTIPLEPYSRPEVIYTGRHLAYTKSDRWYYEWALFVPTRPSPPAATGPEVVRMLCRFNLPVEQEPAVGNPVHKNPIAPDEFDLFVRGAMAELSDDGVAPGHVTYENVMALARQIRESTTP